MFARLMTLTLLLGTAACSADPHPIATPPAAGSTESGATSAATSAAATTETEAPPAPRVPRKEKETGVPAAYGAFCTGKLTAPVTLLRDDGKVSFSGWDEKAPVGTTFLVSVNSVEYTGYFVTTDGVWASLGRGDDRLDPDVNFTSSCVPKVRPDIDKLPHVLLGDAKLFAAEDFKGPACLLKGATVMTGYGYMAWANESGKLWSKEAKATCGCEQCYSPDIHVGYLIPK